MGEAVSGEDWDALMQILQQGIGLLGDSKVEPVKLSILEFFSTASMLGLQDLADVVKRFEDFLLNTVAPDWNGEAVATLSFAMGGLLEKMQMQEYGPSFSAGLGEVLMYLDVYGDDEPQDEPAPPPAEQAKIELSVAIETEAPPEPSDIDVAEIDTLEDSIAETAASVQIDPAPVWPAPMAPPAPEPEQDPPQPAPKAAPTVKESAPALVKIQEEPKSRQDNKTSLKALTSRPIYAKASELEEKPVRELRHSSPSGPKIPISLEAPPSSSMDDSDCVIDVSDWYEQILSHDPTSKVFIQYAEALAEAECWHEVIRVCRQGLVYHPDHLRGLILLGCGLWKTGKVEKAQDILEKAQSELEQYAILYKCLAEMAEGNDDPQKAGKLLTVYEGMNLAGAHRASRRHCQIPSTSALDEVNQDEDSGNDGTSKVASFLSSLLLAYEGRATVSVEQIDLFSDSDRQALREALSICSG